MDLPNPSFRRLALAVALSWPVALAGCTSLGMSPSSVVKLSRLSPLEANPADIVLALRAPDYLHVRDGDIKLTITFDGGRDDTKFVEQYAAILIRDPGRVNGIDQSGFGTDHLTVARLATEDVAAMRKIQSRILKLRATGLKGKGSISIGAGGCYTRDPGDEKLLISAWIQTQPTDAFFPLMKNFDIGKLLAKAHVPEADIQYCSPDET